MDKRRLSVEWFRGIPDDKREAHEKSIRHATLALNALKEIVEEDLRAFLDQETGKDVYETPAWAYQQADLNGRKKYAKKLLQLLSFLN